MRKCTTLTVALMLLAVAAHSAEHGGDARLSTPENLKWQEGPKSIPPGTKQTVLEGNPAKNGPFVMRLLLPDGYKIPAHTDPTVERPTVISGAFHIVMGDNLDPKTATKMPAGSFGYWPAGMKHVVWADGEKVVQLDGIDPWSIVYVNPADDLRNKR